MKEKPSDKRLVMLKEAHKRWLKKQARQEKFIDAMLEEANVKDQENFEDPEMF